jgi:hypothetical protein
MLENGQNSCKENVSRRGDFPVKLGIQAEARGERETLEN